MKRLLGYLKRHLAATILAPLFKMLEASFELIVPIVVARMIDIGVSGRDTSYILQQGVILLLLSLVGFGVSVTAQYFSAKVATKTGTYLRSDLYQHIQGLSWKQIDEIGTSTLITRMTSDINTVQNGVNMFLRLFLRSPFVVFGAVFMAYRVDGYTANAFGASLPVLVVIVFAILLITMPLYKKVQKQLDIIMRFTRENLMGVRVVRAFNRQDSEIRAYDDAADALYGKQIFVGKISALLNPLTYVVINLGIVGILWLGGNQVNVGNLTQGEVIALINYMSQILVELIKLANLIILLSRAIASMNRVDSVFEIKNTRVDGTLAFPESVIISAESTQSTDTANDISAKKHHTNQDTLAKNHRKNTGTSIAFDDVTFSYQEGSSPALDHITFRAEAGSTIGIIGGTGSGKSTLINLLPRFYDIESGSIRVNDTDICDIKIDDLRRHIGIVPQKAVLFQGTLRDNMKWGNENATDEEIYEALEIAQAKDFVEQKAEGLDLYVEQEGRNFSGGQRQRLTIARALVRKPNILILDDSASALDFATDAKLRSAIHTRIQNCTVILVSQRVSTIRNADEILVLDDGTLAGSGTHYELIAGNEIYREICDSQMTDEEIQEDLHNYAENTAMTEIIEMTETSEITETTEKGGEQ